MEKKYSLHIALKNGTEELINLSDVLHDSEQLSLIENDSCSLAELLNLLNEIRWHDPTALERVAQAKKRIKRKPGGLPLSILDNIPGLVGRIAHWITEHAQRPQPSLSLGAALSLVALLKGHKVQTETGLRTNLYMLGLGGSGTGKEHPSRMIQLLAIQADHGPLISGEPTSDAGLLRALQSNRGRSLIVWDEIGHALQALTARNVSPHERKIIKVMLQLFTKANSVYIGKEYGNADSRTPRQDINQPHLCVWGTTVPERFYSAITSENAVDGFLPRWLVVQADDEDTTPISKPIVEDAPEELVEAIRQFRFLPENVRARGNLDAQLEIRPAIIKLSPFARDEAEAARIFFHERMFDARNEGRGLDALWNRAWEHTMKVALTVTDGEYITEREVRWSREFVTFLCEQASTALTESVAENDLHRKQVRLMDLIRSSPGIKHKDLLRQTGFAIMERDKIISSLVASELVRVEERSDGGAGRPSKRYFPLY